MSKLPKYSYSKLELFNQCKYKYKLKYIDGNYINSESIILDLGTIAHKGYELKGQQLIERDVKIYELENRLNNIKKLKEKTEDIIHIEETIKNQLQELKAKEIDYDEIIKVVYEGCYEENKGSNHGQYLKGVNEIKNKHFKDFYTPCSKTGLTYEDKMKIYIDNLKNPIDGDWKVIAVEQPFEIVYNNRCILHGYIDRVDMNSYGDIRVVDYKTSKAIYDEKKIKTPLQMVIYSLACKELYGKYPIECLYEFIFINEKQIGGSKGYMVRGEKKLNSILDEIDNCFNGNEYIPSATPLCYWCDYTGHSPLANDKSKGMCLYNCLWTPTKKNFAVNKKYGDDIKAEVIKKEANNPFVKTSKPKVNPFLKR